MAKAVRVAAISPHSPTTAKAAHTTERFSSEELDLRLALKTDFLYRALPQLAFALH